MPEIDLGTCMRYCAGWTLARIDQIDPVLVSFRLAYADLLALCVGQSGMVSEGLKQISVSAISPSGETLPRIGQLVFIGRIIDEDGQIQVWASLPNPDRILLPGWHLKVCLSVSAGAPQATD